MQASIRDECVTALLVTHGPKRLSLPHSPSEAKRVSTLCESHRVAREKSNDEMIEGARGIRSCIRACCPACT